MKTLSDEELAETETLLRRRLAQLADHAPTTVQVAGEVQVVALDGRRRRTRRRFGAIAAVTALVGAGSFTTYSFLGAGNEGGAATPQEAVTTFMSAFEHEDLLGMIDVTLPVEVGVLRDAVTSATSDATRLDLLNGNFDARSVNGVDFSVAGLTLNVDYLEGGLAAVTATAGTFNASFDPQAFPFGAKLRTLLGAGQRASRGSIALGGLGTPALLMTVERGGRWYVSVEYTLAEYVRRAENWESPGPVTRSPVGFDTPEGAVNGFYDRLAALDLQGAIDTFAPGEDAIAWLTQSWMPAATASIEQGRANGWTLAVSGLTYDTIGSDTHRTLTPVTFKVEGTVPAGLNSGSDSTTGGSQPFTIERADGCTSYLGTGVESMLGLVASPQFEKIDGGYRMCGAGLGAGAGLLLLFGGVSELPAVSVVESDGKWYVSPLGTAVASVSTGLHGLDAGSSLFDSALAPFLYGGMTRQGLVAFMTGQSAASVDPACLPALTVVDGTVTGVAADPARDAVRACATTSFDSESSANAPIVTMEPPAIAKSATSGTEPATPVP